MKNNHIKNIYLHIGTLKTATSSIQDTLYANRELLELNNYFYSKAFPKNHSTIFQRLFSDTASKSHTSIKFGLDAEKIELINNGYIETIRQEIGSTGCNNVIYSAELISTFTMQELEKLKEFFNNLVPMANIHVLISIRNPIDYINSFVQQRKKTCIDSNFDFTFKSQFQKLFTVFGKEQVVAYKFEDACQNKFGPVGHFLNIVGISNDLINDINIITSNSSVSDKAIDIIDFINHRIPMLDGNQISEGRMHLDHYPFHELTGKKFQLGKDYFDVNIGLKTLSESCQWLKDNLKIEYTLKEIPDQAPQIIYDDAFSEEIKSIYIFLTPVLKKLTYDYIKERSQTPNIDSVSAKTLNQLLVWFASNSNDIGSSSISDIIKSQRAYFTSDNKHRSQLLKRLTGKDINAGNFFRDIALFLEHYDMSEKSQFFINKAKKSQRANFANDNKRRNQLLKRFTGEDIRAGNFFRDIALFLEHYEMIEESLFFMSKAKMYSPTLKQVNEKIKEYKSKLELASPPPSPSLINTIRKQIKRTLLLIRSVWT